MRARSLATAAAAASPEVDWALIRSKMMTEEGRSETDRARDAFNKRLVRGEAEGGEGCRGGEGCV